jgi:NitT/TauT family transport system permease protein
MTATQLKTSLRVLSFVVFFGCWQGAVYWFNPALLPAPAEVLQRLLAAIGSGELPEQLLITLFRVGCSFVLAILLGALIGLAMGHIPWLDWLLDGVVTIALNIPALVVIILCFIWFGLNEWTVISAVVINKTPSMIVIFREGARAIDFQLLEVAQSFGLPRWRSFSRTYLPQLYPYFLAAARSGLALVWKIVLVVELLGCSDGVGFQFGVFFQYFDITGILAYTAAFVLLIVAIESLLIRPWEASVMKWRN